MFRKDVEDMQKDFMVGMAKEDITPKLDCQLYGYPWERIGRRVRDGLNVSAVAVSREEESILWISADICALDHELCDRIRKEISEKTGVKWENILYSAIHTHSGPVTRTSVGWGEADVEYVEQKLIPASIDVACRAMESRKPAVMGIGTTESKAGINRREVTSEGIILGQNPDGPYDPVMTVIAFQTVEGEKIGSVVHFATHPTATQWNFSITRDWPGEMVDKMEEITGAPCMFVNGAEGDVGPRLSNRGTTGDERHVKQIGIVAGKDAERAYRSIVSFTVPKLCVSYGEVCLPFQETPSPDEVERQLEELGDPKQLGGVHFSLYTKLQKIKEYYDSGKELPRQLKMQQTIVTLDELALVPFCFEVFCNIGLSLKEKSPYRYTLPLGLTGGSYGYIPTEDQLPLGGYEVLSFRAFAGKPVSLVDNTDKIIVEQNAKLLRKVYGERA